MKRHFSKAKGAIRCVLCRQAFISAQEFGQHCQPRTKGAAICKPQEGV